jgi:peptidoglycan/LPS O-acetylase OafA/YrhL
MGYARIDGISWTLEVELYFYLFMAAAGPALLKSGARGIVLCVLGLLVASVPMVLSRGRWFIGMQVSSGLMLVSGVAYAMFVLNRIQARPLVLLQAGILVALSGVWVLIHHRQGLSLQWLVGYHVAMAVFAVCFAYWRDKRIGRVLNHFADISYPLYVVHGLFGYTIMYGIVVSTGSVLAAIAGAFLSAWAAAWMVHRLVEDPAQRISRRLTAARPVPAPA